MEIDPSGQHFQDIWTTIWDKLAKATIQLCLLQIGHFDGVAAMISQQIGLRG